MDRLCATAGDKVSGVRAEGETVNLNEPVTRNKGGERSRWRRMLAYLLIILPLPLHPPPELYQLLSFWYVEHSDDCSLGDGSHF